MNAYIMAMTVFALYLGGALLILFIGGLLVRTDMDRALAESRGTFYPRSRLLEDLRPVQTVMIEFIAESAHCREFMQRLAHSGKPIPLRRLLGGTPAVETKWTALFIMGVAGLLRFSSRGVMLTDLGREILVRINDGDLNNSPSKLRKAKPIKAVVETETQAPPATDHSHSLVPHLPSRNGSAPLSTVLRSNQKLKLGQLQIPSAATHDAAVEEKKKPLVTAADHWELTAAIVAAKKLTIDGSQAPLLQEKLVHATVVPRSELPPDVITMYTRAELGDVETNERLNFMLVYPVDANMQEGRISVFHPLGVAMLGQRIGDKIEWTVPYGVRRFEVAAVEFQPEAALTKAA
jgi:regulator of nucleoside diphosphate kinase